MMHTKEPWFCRDGDQFQHDIIVTTDDRLCRGVVPICEIESDFTGQVGDEQKENARRIVAAVNACAGIPTEDLEAVTSFETAGVTTVRAVKKQRDELLAALLRLRGCIHETRGPNAWEALTQADEAIARAQGEAK